MSGEVLVFLICKFASIRVYSRLNGFGCGSPRCGEQAFAVVVGVGFAVACCLWPVA